MKRKLSLLTTAAILFLTLAFNLTKTNFNGTWVLNKSKSHFGNVSDSMAPTQIKIIQEDQSLMLQRSFYDGTDHEYYDFSGKRIDTTMGDYKKTSFITWSDDEKWFEISSLYKVTPQGSGPWQYTRTEDYSLSEDGKLLRFGRKTVLPDGVEAFGAVYDKQ